jgi:hypothetical protein
MNDYSSGKLHLSEFMHYTKQILFKILRFNNMALCLSDENITHQTLNIKHAGVAVTLGTCIREIFGLNLGLHIGYPDGDLWWFSSVPTRKFWG